jgi:hypothetical protein
MCIKECAGRQAFFCLRAVIRSLFISASTDQAVVTHNQVLTENINSWRARFLDQISIFLHLRVSLSVYARDR